MNRVLLLVVVGALGLVQSAYATPIVIQYQATDLANQANEPDLWQYTYFVSDFDFQANQGFKIFFDVSLYESLESPPPLVNGDWDAITIPPDPNLPDPGQYDALALVNGASLADPFVLSFVWLGPAAGPGSQPFVVYELDAVGDLTILEQGTTVPFGAAAIPEPSTLLLMSAGAGAFLRRRQRRARCLLRS
jgi:hypothetical protein